MLRFAFAAGGFALLLGLFPIISRVATDGIKNSLPTVPTAASSPTRVVVDRTSTTSTTSTTATTTIEAVTTTSLPFAPPTITFTCPKTGGGWVASAVPTEYRTDADGFHLWYQFDNGSWGYWGLFKSGLADVYVIGGLRPAATFHLKASRSFSTSAPTEPEVTFTVPNAPC